MSINLPWDVYPRIEPKVSCTYQLSNDICFIYQQQQQINIIMFFLIYLPCDWIIFYIVVVKSIYSLRLDRASVIEQKTRVIRQHSAFARSDARQLHCPDARRKGRQPQFYIQCRRISVSMERCAGRMLRWKFLPDKIVVKNTGY